MGTPSGGSWLVSARAGHDAGGLQSHAKGAQDRVWPLISPQSRPAITQQHSPAGADHRAEFGDQGPRCRRGGRSGVSTIGEYCWGPPGSSAGTAVLRSRMPRPHVTILCTAPSPSWLSPCAPARLQGRSRLVHRAAAHHPRPADLLPGDGADGIPGRAAAQVPVPRLAALLQEAARGEEGWQEKGMKRAC